MLMQTGRKRFIDYLHEFIHDSKSIGILLLACTVVSLVAANLSGIGILYSEFLHRQSSTLHHLYLPHSLEHFINDGLMAVFFFLVGLEIKRELVSGELSSVKQAFLPIGAAIGGMVVPAFIFMIFNKGTAFQNGWGIPMATDIAFSLGVAAMLGNRFPPGLKVFLTALAIIDDLGAILVIAFFYGGVVKLAWLAAAALCLILLWFFNRRKMQFGWLHIMVGLALWYFVFNSGIHATIAGVLFAFMIPNNQLGHLEHILHKPVNFVVLPFFALANTAIVFDHSMLADIASTLSAGVFAGLYLGKPLGIFLACRLMVRNKIAELPHGITWRHLLGAGVLAGIGFTMSIFIAVIAFDDKDMQNISKLVILVSGLLSIITAFIFMKAADESAVDLPGKEPEETASLA